MRPDFLKSITSWLVSFQQMTLPFALMNLLIRKPNIFDNMVAILEKHASNLEKQVAERTRLLTEEKKKTDALLYSMLPRCKIIESAEIKL